jgi:hypothetical protein
MHLLIKLYIGLFMKNSLTPHTPGIPCDGVCDDSDDSQSDVFEVAGGGDT